MLNDTTIIMYDFDRIKNTPLEFSNLTSTQDKQKLKLRLYDMQETIKSLESMFGGTILLVNVVVIDKHKNSVALENEPIALEVAYYLNSREIEYVKSIDKHLICVM